LMEKIFHQQH